MFQERRGNLFIQPFILSSNSCVHKYLQDEKQNKTKKLMVLKHLKDAHNIKLLVSVLSILDLILAGK